MDGLLARTRDMIADGVKVVQKNMLSRNVYASVDPEGKEDADDRQMAYWKTGSEAVHMQPLNREGEYMFHRDSGNHRDLFQGAEDLFSILVGFGLPLASMCDMERQNPKLIDWPQQLEGQVLKIAFQFDVMVGFREKTGEPSSKDPDPGREPFPKSSFARVSANVRNFIKFVLSFTPTGVADMKKAYRSAIRVVSYYHSQNDCLPYSESKKDMIDEYVDHQREAEVFSSSEYKKAMKDRPDGFGKLLDPPPRTVVTSEWLKKTHTISAWAIKRLNDASEYVEQSGKSTTIVVMLKRNDDPKIPENEYYEKVENGDSEFWSHIEVKSYKERKKMKRLISLVTPHKSSILLQAAEHILFMDNRSGSLTVLGPMHSLDMQKAMPLLAGVFSSKKCTYVEHYNFIVDVEDGTYTFDEFKLLMKELQAQMNSAIQEEGVPVYYATGSYMPAQYKVYVWFHPYHAYQQALRSCRALYMATQAIAGTCCLEENGLSEFMDRMMDEFKETILRKKDVSLYNAASAYIRKYFNLNVETNKPNHLERLLCNAIIRSGTVTTNNTVNWYREQPGPWVPLGAMWSLYSRAFPNVDLLHKLCINQMLQGFVVHGEVACEMHRNRQADGLIISTFQGMQAVFGVDGTRCINVAYNPVDLNYAQSKTSITSWAQCIEQTNHYSVNIVRNQRDYVDTIQENLHDPTNFKFKDAVHKYWLAEICMVEIYYHKTVLMRATLHVQDEFVTDSIKNLCQNLGVIDYGIKAVNRDISLANETIAEFTQQLKNPELTDKERLGLQIALDGWINDKEKWEKELSAIQAKLENQLTIDQINQIIESAVRHEAGALQLTQGDVERAAILEDAEVHSKFNVVSRMALANEYRTLCERNPSDAEKWQARLTDLEHASHSVTSNIPVGQIRVYDGDAAARIMMGFYDTTPMSGVMRDDETDADRLNRMYYVYNRCLAELEKRRHISRKEDSATETLQEIKMSRAKEKEHEAFMIHYQIEGLESPEQQQKYELKEKMSACLMHMYSIHTLAYEQMAIIERLKYRTAEEKHKGDAQGHAITNVQTDIGSLLTKLEACKKTEDIDTVLTATAAERDAVEETVYEIHDSVMEIQNDTINESVEDDTIDESDSALSFGYQMSTEGTRWQAMVDNLAKEGKIDKKEALEIREFLLKCDDSVQTAKKRQVIDDRDSDTLMDDEEKSLKDQYMQRLASYGPSNTLKDWYDNSGFLYTAQHDKLLKENYVRANRVRLQNLKRIQERLGANSHILDGQYTACESGIARVLGDIDNLIVTINEYTQKGGHLESQLEASIQGSASTDVPVTNPDFRPKKAKSKQGDTVAHTLKNAIEVLHIIEDNKHPLQMFHIESDKLKSQLDKTLLPLQEAWDMASKKVQEHRTPRTERDNETLAALQAEFEMVKRDMQQEKATPEYKEMNSKLKDIWMQIDVINTETKSAQSRLKGINATLEQLGVPAVRTLKEAMDMKRGLEQKTKRTSILDAITEVSIKELQTANDVGKIENMIKNAEAELVNVTELSEKETLVSKILSLNTRLTNAMQQQTMLRYEISELKSELERNK